MIELLVAIAVFVGLTVLSLPSIRGLVDNYTSNRAVDEIISDLHAARMLAVRHGRDSTVKFNDPADGQYTVTWNAPQQSRVVDLTSFRHGVRLEPNPPGLGGPSPAPVDSIVFTPRGFTSAAPQGWGDIYITDQDANKVIRIEVSFSGAISQMGWDSGNNRWIYK